MTEIELQNHYRELLDYCCGNGLKFFETGDPNDLTEWLTGVLPSSVFGDFGETKAVLYDDELPYVIKIPLMRHANSKNYCDIELSNYSAAEEIPEIAGCFAWMDFLFEYHGFPIYIMEKVDCDEEEVSSRAYDSSFKWACSQEGFIEGSKEYEEFSEEFEDRYYDWSMEARMESFLEDEWTYQIFKIFQDFCWEHGINDLHAGNFGFRDGFLVVIDYSGYYGG